MLDSAADGQVVALRGKVVYAPHDMTLEIPGCADSVVLVYASDGSRESPREGTAANGLEQFRKYTAATKKRVGKVACVQCPKYDVQATLTGRLSIGAVPPGMTKDNLGFLRDSSGKIVGKSGFGHPIPIFKYQLAIEDAADVVARQRK